MPRLTRSVVLLAAACLGAMLPPSGVATATGPSVRPAVAPQAVPRVTRNIALRTPSTLSSKWKALAAIPYGTPVDRLGTSLGGDGGGILWGPSYGVQVPDGTWWYADAAKLRLAHYADDGAYLGQVKLPPQYLGQGVYFQWQNPQALADGTVVLTSTTIDEPALLLLSPTGTLSKVALPEFVSVRISNGHRLYGFGETGQLLRIAPRTGTVTPVSAFAGQGGRTFRISTAPGRIDVSRPGVNLRIRLSSADHPGRTVHPSIEVAMGATGRLWILVIGIVDVSADRADTVIGLFNVDTAGDLSLVYKVRTPTSGSDPGDGYHLGVRHGGTRPWLMFVDTDALRTYRKK